MILQDSVLLLLMLFWKKKNLRVESAKGLSASLLIYTKTFLALNPRTAFSQKLSKTVFITCNINSNLILTRFFIIPDKLSN